MFVENERKKNYSNVNAGKLAFFVANVAVLCLLIFLAPFTFHFYIEHAKLRVWNVAHVNFVAYPSLDDINYFDYNPVNGRGCKNLPTV